MFCVLLLVGPLPSLFSHLLSCIIVYIPFCWANLCFQFFASSSQSKKTRDHHRAALDTTVTMCILDLPSQISSLCCSSFQTDDGPLLDRHKDYQLPELCKPRKGDPDQEARPPMTSRLRTITHLETSYFHFWPKHFQ